VQALVGLGVELPEQSAGHAFGKPFGLPELGKMILPDQWSVRPRNPGCVCTAKTAFIEESHGIVI
jgi:hypothetical protein